jgi:hypothetical protein
MNRSRVLLVSTLSVVGLGLLVAFGVRLAFVRAAVGPLPSEALDLPPEVRSLVGLDVKRFVASPFYAKFGQAGSPMRLQAFDELKRSAGIDPERDIDRLIVASLGSTRKEAVALALGRFDTARLDQNLTSAAVGMSKTAVGGTSLYRSSDPSRPPRAIAILGPGSLALGSASMVEDLVARRGGGALKGNAQLLALVERIGSAHTFWMVTDDSALSQLDATSRPSGAPSLPLGLPPFKNAVITADFEPEVTLALGAETADEQTARNLADMIRGFVALASLQAQQKPELAELSRAVTTATEGPRVNLSCRASYALLEALMPKRTAAPASPAGAPATPPPQPQP